MEKIELVNLFCGGTPRDLAIEAKDGSWDMAKFREHVDSCPICTFGVGKIMGMIASSTSPKKAAASRANAGKPPKKGSRPRGRPKKSK